MEVDESPPIDRTEIRSLQDAGLREKLLVLFDSYQKSRETASNLQKVQIEKEQEIFELQQQCGNLESKFYDLTQTSNDLKEQVKLFESERVERTKRLFELEQSHDAAQAEKTQLKLRCDQLISEKATLSEVIDSRNNDLETKKTEITALQKEIRSLITQRCEVQVKLSDVENRELSVAYRENRLKEERELLVQEKEWLQNELLQRDQTVLQLRKEMSKHALEYQTATALKDTELAETKTALENANSNCSRLTDQLDNLNKKMKEAADDRAVAEESYEKELQCQIRLVQVYKQAADEAESKVEELASSLGHVQQLFNEAKEGHFAAQEQIKQIRSDFEEELKGKETVIAELRDELEKANELLRSKHRVMLSEEEVAALSPAAAAASKLIKSGVSLTQIYREHVKTLEELEQQKLDNKRIEGYFRELVQDIERKAPVLRQQQDKYMQSLATIENMKRQLEHASKDQHKLVSEKDGFCRQLTYTKAELERYQRDNADLSAQVRELLWCMERMRAGDPNFVAPLEMGRLPSAEDLHLFRSIDELQAKYQAVLSQLREAEARRDEMVKAAQEAEMSKIRGEIDGTLREIDELRNQREKQNQLLESVRDERDAYKRLLHQAEAKKDTAQKLSAVVPSEEKIQMQEELQKLKTEFEVYRKQKIETEKLQQERIDKYETTLTELRSTNAKLNGEVEYQMERFKISSGNLDTYKKENKGLQERIEKLIAIIAKHEEAVARLTNEVLSLSEEKTRLKVENDRLNERLQISSNNESMAKKEAELLRKDQYTQKMVSTALQELDARLKRREAEDTLKMKSELDRLTQERNNLQSSIKTLTEQSQEYIRDCKAKIVSLEAKLEDEQKQGGHLRSQLQWTEEQLKNANDKIQELKTDLGKMQESYQDASAGRFQKEAQQLQTRLHYLEIRYTESTKKIDELTEQLNLAKNEIQHYRRMADSLEGGLKEHKETSQTERHRFDVELTTCKDQLDIALTENIALKNEISTLNHKTQETERSIVEKEASWKARMLSLEKELQSSKSVVEQLKRQDQELRAEHENLNSSLKEFRDKFEEEFMAHSGTRETLATAQEQLQQALAQLSATESELASLSSELESQKAFSGERENEYEARLQTATDRLQEVQRQNELLLNEIEKLTNQVVMFERFSASRAAGDVMDVPSFDTSGSDESSTSALMEVIRSLRREKQQESERSDILDAEVRRLKSRDQLMEREFNDIKAELETAQKEAAIAATATAEKNRLLAQLASLQSAQAANKELREQNETLTASINDLKRQVKEHEEQHSLLSSQLEEIRNHFEDMSSQAEAFQQESLLWHQRYETLMEERSKFEPEEVAELRKTIDGHLNEISEYQRQQDELVAERDQSLKQMDDLTMENQRLKNDVDLLSTKATEVKANWEKARILAVKYRNQCQEFEDKVNALKGDVQAITEQKEKLEMEKKEIEARCSALELRSRHAAAASLDPASAASIQINELLSKLEKSEKELEEAKRSMIQTGQMLVLSQGEKKQLEVQLSELQAKTEKWEEVAEERKSRLDLLTSLHALCESKKKELTSQFNSLAEQYQNEKASWERQLQETRTSSKATPVQLVSAMPAGAGVQPERQSPAGNHEQRTAPVRPSRQFPTVASVRPIASQQRSTAPILPTAVSPGPSYPDQSSSVTSLPPVPISISAPIITSSQSSNTFVPHAVVQPHMDFGQGTVSGSSDFGDISSSSVVITVFEPPGTSEASAAGTSIPEAPVVSAKRRPPQDPGGDTTRKRQRANSPGTSEQVSTSETFSYASLLSFPLPEEILETGPGLQPTVGSSLDDSSNDVIFVEEVETRGGIEPESTEQEQIFDESAAAGANLASADTGAGPSGGRQQSQLASALVSGFGWDAGDDGIVPSTPTLLPRRADQEIGGAAHVPQTRFTWASYVQEPTPTAPAFQAPSIDITAHRSVPSTPRIITPPQISEREAASSSTVVDVINLGADQQPQPSGQAAESVEHIINIEEESEGTSEAVAAKAEGTESGGNAGEDDSNEPTTSQSGSGGGRIIRLRRRPDEPTAREQAMASMSQPATSTVSGRPNLARRGRGGRSRGTRK